ncbi:mucin-19-like [Sycon ciliatum]|uniref:mucin-19-like n=1 Tax=Sycon ciliatum TaxID=27933 RepID=UPI0031F62784
MDGCEYKESKWRKNTCANCFQAKSSHSNFGTTQREGRGTMSRSESWEVKRTSATLPNRHSNRYSSGSSISAASIGLERSNSSVSSTRSSTDLSKSSPSALRKPAQGGSEVECDETKETAASSPATLRSSAGSSVPARTPPTSTSSSSPPTVLTRARTNGESSSQSTTTSMDSSKPPPAKPPTARKPGAASLRVNPARTAVPSKPSSGRVVSKQHDTGVIGDAAGPKPPPPKPAVTSRRKSPTSASTPTSDDSSILASPVRSAAVDRSCADGRGRHEPTTSTVVQAASPGAMRPPQVTGSSRVESMTTVGTASAGESVGVGVLKIGSAGRSTDDRTLVSSTSAASNASVTAKAAASGSNHSSRGTVETGKRAENTSSSSPAAAQDKKSGARVTGRNVATRSPNSGSNSIATSSGSSNSSTGTATARGDQGTSTVSASSLASSPSSASSSSNASQPASMSSTAVVNGHQGSRESPAAAAAAAGSASTGRKAEASRESSTEITAQLVGSDDSLEKKLAPAKPSRSKLSYSASPDLLRAHASKTEKTTPAASPARTAYEDIWTPTKTAASGKNAGKENGTAGTGVAAGSKPQAKSRSPLSPSSSDLDKMMSGTSTDLDAIISGQKRPNAVASRRAGADSTLLKGQQRQDTQPSVPPVHNYTEAARVSVKGGADGNTSTDAGSLAKAETESIYSVPGDIRPFSPSEMDEADGSGSTGEYKSPRKMSDYNVPRPVSSASLHTATTGSSNSTGGGSAMQRCVSEAVVSVQQPRPQPPARSKSRSSVSRPSVPPPPPPAGRATADGGYSPTEVRVDGNVSVVLRKPSAADDVSPQLVRRNTMERTKRHTISGKPHRIPPPPPPGTRPAEEQDASPRGERRRSICTPPPQRKITGSGTAPAALETLMKSVTDAGSSVGKLSPKIGSKVWKNLRKTHERTMSMIRQRRPGRKNSVSQFDTSDDEHSPGTSRDPSRAPSVMDSPEDETCRTPTPGDYTCDDTEPHSDTSPEMTKSTPPRKPLRTASSFRRNRRNLILPADASGDNTGSSLESPCTTIDRTSSNNTTGSQSGESVSSTQSLRCLIDASLAGIGDSLPPPMHSNVLPLPPKPSRPASKPAGDAPALPPRQPDPASPGAPTVLPRTKSVKGTNSQLPATNGPVQKSPAQKASTPGQHFPPSAPVPPSIEQELERELSLMRSDYHGLTRSVHRSLGSVVKRLGRCVCEERFKSSSVPKNWSHIEVLGCEDDGPHGTCSIHVLFKSRDGKIPMTAQLEPLLTGNDEDGLLYTRDCAVRESIPPHFNVIRTQAKFTETVPELVHEMLELGISPATECSSYMTESTADYTDAEVFFSSLTDQDMPAQEVISQTAFVFVQICSALQHLAVNGIVHRNVVAPSIMIGPVNDKMSPIRNGDRVLLTSFGHALSLPSSPNSGQGGSDQAKKLVFKRSAQQTVVTPRRTDILPPEIRLHLRAEELDYSGCDAYSLGMLMRSVIDISVLAVFQRVCRRLCMPKLSERATVKEALRAFQCTLWGPTEAEVPGWTNQAAPLDRDRLCAWLDMQRSERLGALTLKLCRFKISLEDYLQCLFLSTVTMDELLIVQETFFIGT